jgi:hypothetical protein
MRLHIRIEPKEAFMSFGWSAHWAVTLGTALLVAPVSFLWDLPWRPR